MSAAMRQIVGAAKEIVLWMRGLFLICNWEVSEKYAFGGEGEKVSLLKALS